MWFKGQVVADNFGAAHIIKNKKRTSCGTFFVFAQQSYGTLKTNILCDLFFWFKTIELTTVSY